MTSKVTADVLVLVGLILATWGSTLLGLGALGADELIHEDTTAPKFTWGGHLSLTATVNTTTRFIVLTIIGFAISLAVTHNALTATLPALLSFFVWRILSALAERLTWSIAKHPPWLNQQGRGGISCILGCFALLLFGIPWIILGVTAFGIWATIEYGVTLPSYWVGERTVRPAVLKIYEQLASLGTSESRFGFRKTAFTGMVYLFIGFIYQLLGAAYLLSLDIHNIH